MTHQLTPNSNRTTSQPDSRSTSDYLNEMQNNIKMVKQERRNIEIKHLATARDSKLSKAKEYNMENTVMKICNEINSILEDSGRNQIQMVIYPQFCRMFNIDQLKDTFIKLIQCSENKLREPPNDSKIKYLTEENNRLTKIIDELNKAKDDVSSLYISKIDTLNETIKKYKNDGKDINKTSNYPQSDTLAYKYQLLETELNKKREVIDILLNEKSDLMSEVRKLRLLTTQTRPLKDFDELNLKFRQLAATNSKLVSENNRLSCSAKVIR